MRKKKKIVRKKNLKKRVETLSILPVLLIIALLSLFSETIRSIPVGAYSENFDNISFELPKLNSKLIEKKYLNNSLSVIKKIDKQKLKKEIILSEKYFTQKNELIIKQDKEIKKEEIIVAKAPETEIEKSKPKISNQNSINKEIVDIPKIEKTIKIAADVSTTKIVVDGEEKLIPGSSEKNITYMQILLKPNDLDLNLKYARQQGKAGNYKQTIATLERLSMIYPDNVEINLYLLSVLVQADSPDKALTVIEEIKTSEDLTPEDLATVEEIESKIKERKRPRLWNFYADIGVGVTANENVNSVSKTRLQSSSDVLASFNTPMHDRTYTESLGLTATRSLGQASSFMINASVTDSRQVTETTDDFESYGLTLALDTSLGNQSISPYFMLSKTDYQDDADSFSFMGGIGGYFPVGERNSFSYGYSYSDSKNNKNTTDTTANATNAVGHGITLGHDFAFNELISSSTGLGYAISEAFDGTNDYETYDLNFRLNFAFPWAYISVGEALSFNDYMHVDTSTNSSRIRSDYTSTFDIMATKALGDFIPILDPSKSLFVNFSYEKVFSEANIINYDYIADSFSVSFSKNFHLNK